MARLYSLSNYGIINRMVSLFNFFIVVVLPKLHQIKNGNDYEDEITVLVSQATLNVAIESWGIC